MMSRQQEVHEGRTGQRQTPLPLKLSPVSKAECHDLEAVDNHKYHVSRVTTR